MSQPRAQFCLVLHAHLPYIRHPEYPRFLEEEWLFEAISETYVPLLENMESWLRDGVDFRLTMTLSPTLCEMLADPLLQDRYVAHVERLIELCEREVVRKRGAGPFHDSAVHYLDHFRRARDGYVDRWKRNLVGAFAAVQRTGKLEIATSAATHALLPLVRRPEARGAQVRVAVENYRRHFGRSPRGFWLPECAYAPGLERELAAAGLEYFFLDTHAVLFGAPRPRYGPYAPVACPGGAAAFARDTESSRQVWSAGEGYPGDPTYREFYRDLGFDGAIEEIHPFLHPDGVRRNVGIKYYRITGPVDLHEKDAYRPAAACARAAEHAAHFVSQRLAQGDRLTGLLGRPPLVVAPYDAELFGHWWYEGPVFLDRVMRALPGSGVRPVTPLEVLVRQSSLQPIQPTQSSWGRNGCHEMWLNTANDWIYPHLHEAEERMIALAHRFTDPGNIEWRALNQAARELLLAQGSDWPFILAAGTVVPYAEKRLRTHLARFLALEGELCAGRVDTDRLAEFEGQDNPFSELDYTVYRGRTA